MMRSEVEQARAAGFGEGIGFVVLGAAALAFSVLAMVYIGEGAAVELCICAALAIVTGRLAWQMMRSGLHGRRPPSDYKILR